MQKYLLSLYLLLGTIALYSQEVTKIANFDLFTWQEKPCKYDTKKKNHLRVDNGEMTVVSKSYGSIGSFVLKEIKVDNEYHIFTAHNTRAIRTDKEDFFFNDTIIRTKNQLISIRQVPISEQFERKGTEKTNFKIITQVDSTHWTIAYDYAYQRVSHENVLKALKADTLQSYIDHLDMSYTNMDFRTIFTSKPDSLELIKDGDREFFKSTDVHNYYLRDPYTFSMDRDFISMEWLIMHRLLRREHFTNPKERSAPWWLFVLLTFRRLLP